MVFVGCTTSDASSFARTVDGDTLEIASERIRLRFDAGPIDALELRKAQCPLELFRAQAARERLAALMAPDDFTIERHGKDRYGRTVAVVYSEGVDVASTLVAEATRSLGRSSGERIGQRGAGLTAALSRDLRHRLYAGERLTVDLKYRGRTPRGGLRHAALKDVPEH